MTPEFWAIIGVGVAITSVGSKRTRARVPRLPYAA